MSLPVVLRMFRGFQGVEKGLVDGSQDYFFGFGFLLIGATDRCVGLDFALWAKVVHTNDEN